MRNYNGRKINLVVTDPPYDLPSWTGGGFMDETHDRWKDEINKDNLAKSYNIAEYAKLLERVQQGMINAYFFCNKRQIPEYFAEYVGKRDCRFDILCWHKDNAMPTFHNKYLTDTEYILYFRNSGGYCNPQSYNDGKTYFMQSINLKDKEKWGHPTIKPITIIATLIRNSSKKGDLVFDGFLGSGTTRVAAFREGRDFLGCELNEEWYSRQQERYDKECHGIITNENGKRYQQTSLFS